LVPQAISEEPECKDVKMGSVDFYSGVTGACCSTCPYNANMDAYITPDCNGPAGDATYIDYLWANWNDISLVAGLLGCTELNAGNPETCPLFYIADVNGDGVIGFMDGLCAADYASVSPGCNAGNGWCNGDCVVAESADNPCSGKHIGEYCCLPIEE
jgi:hypothetical protein